MKGLSPKPYLLLLEQAKHNHLTPAQCPFCDLGGNEEIFWLERGEEIYDDCFGCWHRSVARQNGGEIDADNCVLFGMGLCVFLGI